MCLLAEIILNQGHKVLILVIVSAPMPLVTAVGALGRGNAIWAAALSAVAAAASLQIRYLWAQHSPGPQPQTAGAPPPGEPVGAARAVPTNYTLVLSIGCIADGAARQTDHAYNSIACVTCWALSRAASVRHNASGHGGLNGHPDRLFYASADIHVRWTQNCLVRLFIAHDRPTLHFLCRGLPALVAAKHQLDKLVAKFYSDYSWHSGAGRSSAAFD
jgi:hypothetical protein